MADRDAPDPDFRVPDCARPHAAFGSWRCRLRTCVLPTLILSAACGMGQPELAADSFAAAQAIPTTFSENRFLARPVTATGDTMALFTDTGGGLFLFPDAVERLGLETDADNEVGLPAFRTDAAIPAPLGSSDGRIFVLDAREPGAADWDGMLGQAWFADRIWTFDYPGRRLLLWPDSARPADADADHTVTLGFKSDSAGKRILSFPRIRIEIDGDSLDLLLDTGATVRPAREARSQLGLTSEEIGTSFMISSIVDGWRARHPDWRVIENADPGVPGMAMIEVPSISLAGHTVGPVWFTERPDANFHEFMTQFMDRRVDGAIGGSALQYFRVTVDYPRATAVFMLPAS